MALETLWYAVIGIALLFYTVLDGFDLGVGALHLFARGDLQRRTFLNAIGPVWDGNEVWIVIVMGGMFAGFPNVYATIFSGFYIHQKLQAFGDFIAKGCQNGGQNGCMRFKKRGV